MCPGGKDDNCIPPTEFLDTAGPGTFGLPNFGGSYATDPLAAPTANPSTGALDWTDWRHHLGYAMSIDELDYTYMGNDKYRHCFDESSLFIVEGRVIRFNDGTLNQNVTITPKDSTGINNPRLIEDLPAGLYAIEKTDNTGKTEQKVISKQNN